MGNPFVHLDLACDNPDEAQKFYGKVFAWKFKAFPAMKWIGIDVGQGVGGGMGAKQMPEQPSAWTAYVEVDDVKATIAKAEKAGAQILVPHMEVPGMGWLGVFVDPQGATLGVWQSATKNVADNASEKLSKKATKKAGKKAAKAVKAEPAAKPATKKAGKKAASKSVAAAAPAAKSATKKRGTQAVAAAAPVGKKVANKGAKKSGRK